MIAPLKLSLDSLGVAQTARICELVGEPAVRQRLGEMGLTVGSVVRVVRTAPLGDPMQIAVRNYHLSLRRSESRCVLVQREWSASDDSAAATSSLELSGPPAAGTACMTDLLSGARALGTTASSGAPRFGKWVRRLGVAALLFWGIKGLAWVGVAVLLIR